MNSHNKLFDVVERRGSGGFFPLNENHWSNALAWLLESQGDDSVGRSLLASLVPSYAGSESWKTDREPGFEIEDRIRFIDILVSFSNGRRCFIEVKIDRAYQDRSQVSDQLRLLSEGDYFTLLAPS